MVATTGKWTYGLTANVLILSIVSLLTDVSSEMIVPLLPFFLTEVLLASAFIVGLIEGLAEGVVSFLKVFSGRWSDMTGRRKRFVAAGYGVSTAMKVLFPFAATWPQFLGMRVVERTGKGIRDAPRDALLAESTPPETRGKAFGFHRSMDTAGAIIGPLLSLAILAWLSTLPTLFGVEAAYRLVFLLAAIPAAFSLLVVFFVRESARPGTRPPPLRLSLRGAPRSLLSFIGIASLFSLGEFSYVFLLLRVGLVQTTEAAILLYVVFNVVYALAAFPAGTLSDRLGRKPVIVAGYVTFAAMAGILVASSSFLVLGLAFVLYGVSFGLTQGTERALVADLAPPERRATVLGAYHTGIGAVKIASGGIAGLLWVSIAPEATFAFGFGVAIIATVSLALWRSPLRS